MTNVIAKTVHCPTCGSPPGRACQSLNPAKKRIVPTHSARRKLYTERTERELRRLARQADQYQ